MNGEDISIEQLKSWLQDVKRISHEQRVNYHRRQNQLFKGNKLDNVLAHLQAARAELVEIAHVMQRERV